MDILSRVWGALHPPTNISCLEFPSIWTRQVLDPPVSDGTAKADLKMFFLLPDDDNYLAIALSVSTALLHMSHKFSSCFLICTSITQNEVPFFHIVLVSAFPLKNF